MRPLSATEVVLSIAPSWFTRRPVINALPVVAVMTPLFVAVPA